MSSLIVSLVALIIALILGWIGFEPMPTVFGVAWLDTGLVLIAISIVYMVVGWVIARLQGLVVMSFFGGSIAAFYGKQKRAGIVLLVVGVLTALVLYPAVFLAAGYVKLWVTGWLWPTFTFTTVWWKVLILSVAVGYHATHTTVKSSSKRSTSMDE